MKIMDLQKGLSFFRTAEDSEFFKNLKKILSYSSVTFIDPCCTDGVTSFPVRFNSTGDALEYNNGTDWVALDGVSDSTMIAAYYPQVAQNDIAAGIGGAILVTNYLTTINTDAGGDAFTLADGTVKGQMKKILLVADGGGDGVVTPATAFAGGATTATFNDAGDYLILQWNGTAWRVQENSGVTVA